MLTFSHQPVRGQRALTAIWPRNSSAIPRTHMDMPYFAIVYATKKPNVMCWYCIGAGWEAGCSVAVVTCVVLEPDGVKIDRRRQVEDVGTATLQQVRNDHLRPDTHTYSLTESQICVMCYVYVFVHECVSYVRYVPLRLIPSIRSTFFMGVSRVPVRLMALALFTRMSIPVGHKQAVW